MGVAVLRTIGVVTTARSDYGILLPVLRAIEADSALRLRLLVGGTHLSPEFGRTVDAIERDGFPIDDRIELVLSSDSALGTAKSIALGVMGFAESYARHRPDILLALGDRFEMHAAVLAALPFGIPVAHIHGGEVTEGAIDDALRHGITKMAHLHFPSTEEYAARIIRMGEESWRVTVSGAPSLDNLATVELLDRDALGSRFGFALQDDPLLVTFHPVTREIDRTPAQIEALLGSLGRVERTIVFTLPNADPSGRFIAQRIHEFVEIRSNAHIVDNMGTQAYFSMMNVAGAMVGNSSSGIIEAASFGLPVVNVGMRQAGRVRGPNVIDVSEDQSAQSIERAIDRAVSPEFRQTIKGMTNPYGRGNAAQIIVDRIRDVPLDAALIRKRFYDG